MQPNGPSKRSKTTSSVVCATLKANGPHNYGISWQTKLQPHWKLSANTEYTQQNQHSIKSMAANTIGMYYQWPHQAHALSSTSAQMDAHHGEPERLTHGTAVHQLITTEIASSSSKRQGPTAYLAYLTSSHSAAYSQNSRQYNTREKCCRN